MLKLSRYQFYIQVAWIVELTRRAGSWFLDLIHNAPRGNFLQWTYGLIEQV